MLETKQPDGTIKPWIKGLVFLFTGSFCFSIIILIMENILGVDRRNPIYFILFIVTVFILGLFGGYLSERQYLTTFRNFILSIYGIILVVTMIAILSGGRNFLVTGEIANDLFIGMILASIVGVMITFTISIPLLPAMFLGSQWYRRKARARRIA